jgi:hypothetical protein
MLKEDIVIICTHHNSLLKNCSGSSRLLLSSASWLDAKVNYLCFSKEKNPTLKSSV